MAEPSPETPISSVTFWATSARAELIISKSSAVAVLGASPSFWALTVALITNLNPLYSIVALSFSVARTASSPWLVIAFAPEGKLLRNLYLTDVLVKYPFIFLVCSAFITLFASSLVINVAKSDEVVKFSGVDVSSLPPTFLFITVFVPEPRISLTVSLISARPPALSIRRFVASLSALPSIACKSADTSDSLNFLSSIFL